MFKNKFIQQKYGMCSYTCLANIFNSSDIYTDGENYVSNQNNKGITALEERRLVEHYSNGEMTTQFLIYKDNIVSEYDSSIFDSNTPNTVNNDEEHYNIFLASVINNDNTSHVLVLIKNINNDKIYVLDPYYSEPSVVLVRDFIKEYPFNSICELSSKINNGRLCFPESYLSHLIFEEKSDPLAYVYDAKISQICDIIMSEIETAHIPMILKKIQREIKTNFLREKQKNEENIKKILFTVSKLN